MKISESGPRSVPSEGQEAEPVPKSRGAGAFLLAVLVLLAAFFAVPYTPAIVKNGSDLFHRLT